MLRQTVFCAVLAFASQAHAADVLNVSYDVALGGSNVMRADYSSTNDGGSYSSTLQAKSVGVTKLFAKYSLSIVANGQSGEAGVKPEKYNYFRKKNKKTKERAISFASDGSPLVDVETYGDAIVNAAKKGVTDPLTMLFKLSRSGSPCKGKHRVFDGRDVFDVSLSGGANGNLLQCTVKYTPIAGGDVDDGDTDTVEYGLTMAPLGGKAGYVPVSITGSSKGVPFSVSANSVTLNGQPVSF